MLSAFRRRLSFTDIFVIALLLLALSIAASPARAGTPGWHRATLDTAVQHWKDHGGKDRDRIIVSVWPGRRGMVRRALEAGGLRVKAEHALVDALTLDVPRAALEGLARNPNIAAISLDAPTTPHQTLAPNGATLRATLGLPFFNAPQGTGVGIAIVDSGIAPSAVFSGRIRAFYDFTSGMPRATAPTDPYGHGTHVAGLAAGSGGPSGGLYPGIAPGASLIGLRVLDGLGQGNTSNVIAAIEFAVLYRRSLGIDVINLSLGHPIFEAAATDPLVRAVEAAARSGIVVVVSAGNVGRNPATGEVGYAGITSPGNAASAITVGAVDTKGTRIRRDDSVAPYSSRGPSWYDGYAKPDVVAPGQALTAASSVLAELYQDYPNAHAAARGDATPYLRLSGTSMAAGVVSGVVATLIDAHRTAMPWSATKLSPNAIKAILQFTAVSVTDPLTGQPYDELTQGAGEVNAGGAIQLAQVINPDIPMGAIWASYMPVPSTLIAGQRLAWSQHIVWGDHIVWGSSIYLHDAAWDLWSPWGALDPAHIVWGTIDPAHIVWGDVALWSTHIVWGDALVGTVLADHIVWGDVVDAAHIVWGDLAAEHIVWGDAVTGNSDVIVADEVYLDDVFIDDGSGY